MTSLPTFFGGAAGAAFTSYTWEEPIMAPPTAAVFSGITVYNAGVSPLYGERGGERME